jgi:hypothetical protein
LLGPGVRTIPLAASKDFFNASIEEMSGFRAPARKATPAADLATLMRPAPMSFPCLIRASIPASVMMTASATSPPLTRLMISAVPLHGVEPKGIVGAQCSYVHPS